MTLRAPRSTEGSGAAIEGGLTAVQCRRAVDICRHEGRFRLLPNRVIPHPADPTLEEGAERSEWQQTHKVKYRSTAGRLRNSVGLLL